MEQNIMQKAAYLKGLAEGMELDTSKKENKLMAAVIDLVDELAGSVYSLENTTAEVEDELDEIAEELLAIETQLDDDCDYDCDCEDDCDCDCGCEDDSDSLDEGYFYEVECPTCGEHITLDESLIVAGGIACPNCGEDLEFELDEDDCGCGCDCCEE